MTLSQRCTMGTNATFSPKCMEDVANCIIVTLMIIMSILFSQISGKNLSIHKQCVPGVPPHAHGTPGDDAMSVHDDV